MFLTHVGRKADVGFLLRAADFLSFSQSEGLAANFQRIAPEAGRKRRVLVLLSALFCLPPLLGGAYTTRFALGTGRGGKVLCALPSSLEP